MPGLINLDFADVRTIMKGMGSAMMGMGEGEGEGRALEAARAAIDNPLLDDVSMHGAKGVLINITGGYDMTLFELDEAANEIRREVDPDANIILGSTFDPELEGRLRVSVVAAGIDSAIGMGAVDAPAEAADAVAEEASKPAPASEERPKVVVQGQQEDMFETDPRPDFRGRPLPAAHIEGAEGSDQVSAEEVFSRPQPKPQPAQKSRRDEDESGAGFANLFGWRKGTAQGDNDQEDVDFDEKIVSSPEDHPDAAPFDDADLEIPAFLRRSANH
jgi:cell division protein FtsZ